LARKWCEKWAEHLRHYPCGLIKPGGIVDEVREIGCKNRLDYNESWQI